MANQVRFVASVEDKVSSQLARIRDSFDGLGKGVASSTAVGVIGAKALGAGVGLVHKAMDGAVGAVFDSIKSASDLNETVQKSGVVFGDAAGEIKKFGEGAAASMGMSENAAISAAASIGNLLRSTGTAKDKLAPMSEGIVQLAADLSSFNNIPTDEVLAKLQSGLVGQERPLRELGVAISAASVQAKAAQLGFHAVNGEFTEGEKVQARYALIFEQTATAQGDFARTSDQLAGSQRKVNAELEDASTKIGAQLTPGVTKLENFLAKDFIPTSLNTVDALANIAAQGFAPVARAVDQFDQGAADTIIAVNKINDALGGVPVPWHKAAEAIVNVGQDTDETAKHFRDAGTDMADRSLDVSNKVRTSFDKITAAENKVASTARTAAGAAGRWWGTYRDSLSKIADQTITDAFQPILDNDALVAKNAEIHAQHVIIAESKKTTAAKNSSKAQIRAAREAQTAAETALHQLELDRATMLEKMAKAGDTTSAAYKTGMASLKVDINNASGAMRTALLKVQTIINEVAAAAARAGATPRQNTNPARGGARKPYASGGYFPPGTSGTVGEEGTEGVVMLPGGGAIVIPHQGGSQGAARGGNTYVFHSAWPPTPQQVKSIADALDKHEHYAANSSSASGNRS